MDILNQRLDVLNSIDNYVGKYLPKNFVYKEVFEFTDDEIRSLKDQLEIEKQNGEIEGDDDGGGDMGGGGLGGSMPPPPE